MEATKTSNIILFPKIEAVRGGPKCALQMRMEATKNVTCLVFDFGASEVAAAVVRRVQVVHHLTKKMIDRVIDDGG